MRSISAAPMLALALAALFGGACTVADESTAACPEVVTADGVDVWTDERGCPVPPHEIFSRAGDSTCGWELVDEIVIGDLGAYHWDPVNLLAYVDQQVRNRTFRTADVIDDLTDSGWRRGDEVLWLDPTDERHVYLVRGDQTDRYLLDTEDAIICD
ncbi:MAG: hypothetical protein R8F63_18280 [Acidimicrobiales bacterium]|nr:hypothetical protein [Acidimicrobiales bacterium]